MTDDPARGRWLILTLVRIACAADAVFGLILIGRAEAMVPKLIGGAIVLASLVMIAIVPRALARRWRSPE